MQHSIKEIAENHSKLSDLRKDIKRFNEKDFIQYARDNKGKYSLIDNGDDLLVSTWYSNELINDYRKTIK